GEQETAHHPRLTEPERVEQLLADQARQIAARQAALGEGELPVALRAQPAVLPEGHLTGAELADAGVDRVGRRHEPEGHERLERGRIPGPGERRQRRERQQERPARGVRARPRHRGNGDLAPVRERQQAAHQSGCATISTSPWTTVIPYSTPPVRSLACRRKASCSKWTAVGPSERG